MQSTPPRHENLAVFRFYGELGDFLAESDPSLEQSYRFRGRPAVKDAQVVEVLHRYHLGARIRPLER